MKESFGKEYKLCSKILIDQLFNSGTRIYNSPLQVIFEQQKLTKNVPIQFLISVPKKRFKKAVTRNYIKRLIRELIRKNKLNLETFLREQNIPLAICLIYSSNEILSHDELQVKIEKIFIKIKEHVSKTPKVQVRKL